MPPSFTVKGRYPEPGASKPTLEELERAKQLALIAVQEINEKKEAKKTEKKQELDTKRLRNNNVHSL